MSYEDLKSSELKMEYIKLVRDKILFKESLDYFERHKEFLATNQFYKDFKEDGNKPEELKNYDDLILLYLNCK